MSLKSSLRHVSMSVSPWWVFLSQDSAWRCSKNTTNNSLLLTDILPSLLTMLPLTNMPFQSSILNSPTSALLTLNLLRRDHSVKKKKKKRRERNKRKAIIKRTRKNKREWLVNLMTSSMTWCKTREKERLSLCTLVRFAPVCRSIITTLPKSSKNLVKSEKLTTPSANALISQLVLINQTRSSWKLIHLLWCMLN